MKEITNKTVLVVGLGGRGRAACELLRRYGARVVGVDSADTAELRATAAQLRLVGIEVRLGAEVAPEGVFDLVVLSPAVPLQLPLVQELQRRGVPIIGELELGFQQSKCLTIAIAGTNGKGTTAEMIERLLMSSHRPTTLAGHRARPLCAIVEQSRALDFLIVQASSFQLETTEFFRPAVGVLMNLAPDDLAYYASAEDHDRACGRVFRNQQSFDWAIVQSEALRRLLELGVPVPAKTITFSAQDPSADLHLDRGLLVSRLANWSGPLLDMEDCQIHGLHNAENLMAALAVGHVLRLPLESMVDTLKTHTAGAHRFELVVEADGVQFINDSKATNVYALRQALLSARAGLAGAANVWLVAGGRDQGADYHDLGPLLSKRVKGAFLIGEAAEKIRPAWSLFTACTIAHSLIEAVAEAANLAAPGDVVLLSPACSSLDQFQDYQERGEIFCRAVKSIGRGTRVGSPNIHGEMLAMQR